MARILKRDPLPGVSYPLILRVGDSPAALSLFGIVMALSAFVLVVPLVAQLILAALFAVSGGSDWAAYVAQAGAYHIPAGPLSTNLALAMLTPIALLTARAIHGIAPRWVASVQPGPRWRYGLLCLLLAVVVLNGMLWLRFASTELPAFSAGQPGWVWFALVALLTSPLQAAAEEVFFRGYLLQAIGSATGRSWVGVVGSALVFALFHGVQNPALFAHRFAFGLLAGLLVVVTGGLEAGIAAHIVNNVAAYGYAMFTTSIAELKATSAITWGQAAWDIAGFTVFALLAWQLGKKLQVATVTA